jgi:beta-N-acetylhexosaminidase
MRSAALRALVPILFVAVVSSDSRGSLDKAATRWLDKTLGAMTLEEKIGQLLMPSFESSYLPVDSERFDRLRALVTRRHVAGFLVFGASEAVPPVLLNPTYGSVTLGHPHAAAATLNRLQRLAKTPLINTGDFEFGVGMRIAGATQFPRAMAFGAAGDPSLAEQAGRIVARESRAIGVHVDFAPVADVNNNPRNPVINTRSFGEDPQMVGALASAFVRGLRAGGMLATLKHFPGHGDTDVDTHLGLATIPHDRARLDRIELPPFRLALAAGADAVMIAHVELPGIEPTPGVPATLSEPAITGLLRRDLGFDGLVFTDSMSMAAVAKMASAGEAAARAVKAGADIVLHSPDDDAAADGLRIAVERGEIPLARIDESARRVLGAKARLGLHVARTVDLEAIAAEVGGRAHRVVAETVAARAVTLVRDEHTHVPMAVSRDRSVLALSVLDYPGNWRIAAPGRTFLPALRERWPNLTAIELSDRSSASEIDLVRASAARYDAIVVSVYVRAASASGRLDLAPQLVNLLRAVARLASGERPVVAVFFGNPYVAAGLTGLPAILLTYDFGDLAERAAVRALAGEAAISGRLPVSIPGLSRAGEGQTRPGH